MEMVEENSKTKDRKRTNHKKVEYNFLGTLFATFRQDHYYWKKSKTKRPIMLQRK